MTQQTENNLNEPNSCCKDYSDKLWDLAIQNENGEDTELSAHLASCEECRKEFKRISEIKSSLEKIYTPDASLSSRLDKAIEDIPAKRKSFKLPRYAGTVIAAAAILLVFGISRILPTFDNTMMRRGGTSSPEASYLSDDGSTKNEETFEANNEGSNAHKEDNSPIGEPYSGENEIVPSEKQNQSFNYIVVKEITPSALMNAIAKGDMEINDDIEVSPNQFALSEKDMAKAEAFLKKSGAIIVSKSSDENASFTLIEIKK